MRSPELSFSASPSYGVCPVPGHYVALRCAALGLLASLTACGATREINFIAGDNTMSFEHAEMSALQTAVGDQKRALKACTDLLTEISGNLSRGCGLTG